MCIEFWKSSEKQVNGLTKPLRFVTGDYSEKCNQPFWALLLGLDSLVLTTFKQLTYFLVEFELKMAKMPAFTNLKYSVEDNRKQEAALQVALDL